MSNFSERAIAIVGIGGILPEAFGAQAFWQNVLDKRYSISETPPERWQIEDYYDPDPRAPDKTYSKIGGWVRGFKFDWKRFRMPPKVAAAMDESQQWAVTIAANLLGEYGYPQRPLNTERTATIIGTVLGGELHYTTTERIVFPNYARALRAVPEFNTLAQPTREAILSGWHENINAKTPPITEDTMPGELPNIVSGRVANMLDLRGPNFITDAACASSFAALEAAIELLAEYKVDAVITGGVDRNMGVGPFVKFCKIGALSATGTRPFGAGADGFVMGEGAALFLLKRLGDAERDGDNIYAVIRGVGGASDGKGKGITAPNPIGQQLAVQRAWEAAGLDPGDATLVEAHGTSTRVGDVVEVESLSQVFGSAPGKGIGLGSVKSNIGHLKAGAGAVGMLKATLALHHKILPPTLHAHPPNPNIDFSQTPFYLLHEARHWEAPNGDPRLCGVSAYGFGGTNFHIVLEEYRPGKLTMSRRSFSVEKPAPTKQSDRVTNELHKYQTPKPLRGIAAIAAETISELRVELTRYLNRVESGWTPPFELPPRSIIAANERLIIDFDQAATLLDRLQKAQKLMDIDSSQAWKAVEAQGIFRGAGKPPGKIAFMFPGQGSQYVNMGRELVALSPVVQAVFNDADAVMTPILGKPLTEFIFVDPDDNSAVNQATFDLMQTEITQPAMLTMDIAIYQLLQSYGFDADIVMGHSLGEYAALIVAGVMPFADALEAAAARGQEMAAVEVADNGKMAAVLAPLDVVEEILAQVDGYVVPANINSHSQCVFGGASKAVDTAVKLFAEKEFKVMTLPVSHAFHTSIVAPASEPLRRVLDRLNIKPPRLPLVANVTADFYPMDVTAIKDMLKLQVASTVQWVRGLAKMYESGVRTFVEVGPKRALRGFANDVFQDKNDVLALITNHPKIGALPAFNQALCGLYAAGYLNNPPAKEKLPIEKNREEVMAPPENAKSPPEPQKIVPIPHYAYPPYPISPSQPYNRADPPLGSVVITGTGLGLPGAEKAVMDPDNAMRILHGEQFIDLIPERFRNKMMQKRVTRLIKGADGSGSFATIDDIGDVIKLAGRPGSFDLANEYGVPQKLVDALDITTQYAMAAGLDALREAGIPLVQSYRKTSTGSYLPDRWVLPEPLRDETGVIFASAFPGGDRFVEDFEKYFVYQNRMEQLEMLDQLRRTCNDEATLLEIMRRSNEIRQELAREPYVFDRRFVFRILAMGHSQFAEYIGVRGPNTQLNAACASTTQAIALAEDWIRNGRCRRVVVIAADNVTGDRLMEWIGAGFLALGAAATDDRVAEAALPFDKRRHGTILGMGACALVVESEDAVRERGMRGIVEMLSSETRNSAFHGSRLDVDHIAQVMNDLVTTAERRFDLNRHAIAPQLVFMSHETYTPARGGSAAAEVIALRQTFGDAAKEIVVANTKGFTGHPMGVGIEDVIALKILEHGIVPPVPNYKELDPELGGLNLSRGGRYPVQYALHLAAGFGSQISLTLTRRVPGAMERIDHPSRYQKWLDDISGYDHSRLEIEKRNLRVVANGAPGRRPLPSPWQYGMEPTKRTADGTRRPAVIPPPALIPAQPVAPPMPVAAPAKVERVQINGGDKRENHLPPPNVSPPVEYVEPLVDETIKDPTAADPVIAKVLAIVAEQTGYPPDMLELDLDLEADLGVDTVKQAETFVALRAEFDIPRNDDLSLRDYNTLGKVVEFVREMRSDLAPDNQVADSAAPLPMNAPNPADSPPPNESIDLVTEKVLAIIAEQTGYPPDMLELDLDLEADLGVDTVKQAETFVALRAEFDIPRNDDLSLRDYNTLGKVVEFVRGMRPDLAPDNKVADSAAPLPINAPNPAGSPPPNESNDQVTEKVLAIIAEQTGYPPDMLELDLDLEADLGVDTVKQAETFQAIRQEFEIPLQEDLRLRDYPTLAHVIQFVYEMRPDLKG